MATLRTYRPDDAPALLTLFRDTIRRVNSRDYNPDQIRAWASDDIDPEAWAGRFAGYFVAVAEEAGRPVGFADLDASGHIDRVFVSADHQGRGVARLLLSALVAEARRLGVPPALHGGQHHRPAVLREASIHGANPAGGDSPRG
jgi:putative acetyltransferase